MRLNSDGSPDQSFGLGGVASVDFSNSSTYRNDDYGSAIALQPDGKIIVAGDTYQDPTANGSGEELPAVARLNQNGTLDTSFGTSNGFDADGPGKLVLELGRTDSGGVESFGSSASDVALQSDGGILVAGATGGHASDFVVLKLNADGERDTSYGSSYGFATVDFGGQDVPSRIAVASNGDAIVSGVSYNPHDDAVVARLSPSGSPVAGFGTGGKETLTLPDPSSENGVLNDVVAQPDGKLVFAVSGTNYRTGAGFAGVLRLNADGSDDPLDGNLVQMVPSSDLDEAGAVSIDGAGRMLLSAMGIDSSGAHSFKLARFTSSGSLDTTFAHGAGFITVPLGPGTGGSFDAPVAALQPDGRIVLAGTDNGLINVRRFLAAAPSTSPSPSPTTEPTITKLKLNDHKRRVRLSFKDSSSVAFRCALVKRKKKGRQPTPNFKSCSSPKRYKHLKRGKYLFEVLAVSSAGKSAIAKRRFSI